MKKYVILLCGLMLFSGCAARGMMHVRSFPNPDIKPEGNAKFSTAGDFGDRQLEGEYLLEMVRAELSSRGYRYDPDHPDFSVTLEFSQSAKTEEIPERLSWTRVPDRIIYHRDGTRTRIRGRRLPYTTGGGTREYWSRWIRLIFTPTSQSGVAEKDASGESDVQALLRMWEGEAFSDGKKDLIAVAPCLIRGLLDAFPDQAGIVELEFDVTCN